MILIFQKKDLRPRAVESLFGRRDEPCVRVPADHEPHITTAIEALLVGLAEHPAGIGHVEEAYNDAGVLAPDRLERVCRVLILGFFLGFVHFLWVLGIFCVFVHFLWFF
jgi:hypothetical protein